MVYILMAYAVMAYIVMACILMAYIIMAYIVTAYTVMAYIVMACIVMAYAVMACIFMDALVDCHRRERSVKPVELVHSVKLVLVVERNAGLPRSTS